MYLYIKKETKLFTKKNKPSIFSKPRPSTNDEYYKIKQKKNRWSDLKALHHNRSKFFHSRIIKINLKKHEHLMEFILQPPAPYRQHIRNEMSTSSFHFHSQHCFHYCCYCFRYRSYTVPSLRSFFLMCYCCRPGNGTHQTAGKAHLCSHVWKKPFFL